jgi:acyl-homoserine-lactone acylase
MKTYHVLGIALLVITCSPTEETKTQIAWDAWGVPHITANTIEDLFYAQGWAQMHNHANLILDLYGSDRGRGAEYWGQDKLQSDLLIHTMGFDGLAEEWEANQDPEIRTIYSSFVEGMNHYAKQHPESIEEKNRVVLPLTTKDLNMHGMYIVFTLFVGGNELGRTNQWPDIGSNAFAVGPKRSESGNAMMVQNPHLPWRREFLWFESHLILQGKSLYGAHLVGFPGIATGFNNNLGWSHTNNTIDNADTYELELKEDGYVLDGEIRKFEEELKTLKVKLEGGDFADTTFTLRRTVHGPVVKSSGDKVLALRMVGMDRPNMTLQWWRMINSTTFEEFESALKMAQLPFWNVMYADKQGNIFYLFNGLVPQRSSGDWNYWNRIIPGGRSADIWTEVHPYADLPKLKNPSTGWLQNSNDPPWTSTIPMALDPNDFPPYMAPQGMHLRPQRSAIMFLNDDSITFQELIDYKLSTRLEFADRILDDLFKAVDESGSQRAQQAKAVLENWDRETNVDSKGAVLFHTWARKFNHRQDANYTIKWDIENPVTTPDGIADPARAVQLLEAAADEVEEKFGKLEVPWGDFYRIGYNGMDLPANGIDGSLGVVRVAWPGRVNDDHMFVGGGDSWVGVIEFGEAVNAKVLLSYGNATQKDSPHFGDQLELFSKKELRDAWFTEDEIKANTVKIVTISDSGFSQHRRNNGLH